MISNKVATFIIVVGIVLFVASFAGSSLAGDQDSPQKEMYRYDIHVDSTPYRSASGEIKSISDFDPEVSQTLRGQISSDSLLDVNYYDTIYLDSFSSISRVNFVEYRGFYYKVDVKDHGLVEMINVEEAFTINSFVGLTGMVLIFYGGAVVLIGYSGAADSTREFSEYDLKGEQ